LQKSNCLVPRVHRIGAVCDISGRPASAAFPERIIKIVVPQAPGGGTDAIARVLAQEMARDLGASIIVENKAGAGTIIATQAVV
jgi:tripartite-type tricarboxylate transporter receptor subunit TctC